MTVFDEIATERRWQDTRWGEQNHPDHDPVDVTMHCIDWYASEADRWKRINADRAEAGRTAWDGILLEEVYEALGETDVEKKRDELLQVAAVVVAQIEAIDRRMFDGSTVDATDNPHHDALYDGARAPEACDIDGSHDEVRPAAVLPPDAAEEYVAQRAAGRDAVESAARALIPGLRDL